MAPVFDDPDIEPTSIHGIEIALLVHTVPFLFALAAVELAHRG